MKFRTQIAILLMCLFLVAVLLFAEHQAKEDCFSRGGSVKETTTSCTLVNLSTCRKATSWKCVR